MSPVKRPHGARAPERKPIDEMSFFGGRKARRRIVSPCGVTAAAGRGSTREREPVMKRDKGGQQREEGDEDMLRAD